MAPRDRKRWATIDAELNQLALLARMDLDRNDPNHAKGSANPRVQLQMVGRHKLQL
jgi:hypothetical protein